MNVVNEIRNRLVLLALEHTPTPNVFKVANAPTPDDRTRFGRRAKQNEGGVKDFPSLDIRVGDASETAFEPNDLATISQYDGETSIEVEIRQEFVATIVNFADNVKDNAATVREFISAIRAGRRTLELPGVEASGLAYVACWGPIATRNETRKVRGGVRGVTTLTIPVFVSATEDELGA